MPQGYNVPIGETVAAPQAPQQYPVANPGPQGYHRVPPQCQYGAEAPNSANAAPATNSANQGRNGNNNGYQNGVQCTFCSYNGHTEENCGGKRRAMVLPPEPNWKCRRCNTVGHHYTADCPSRPRDNQGVNGPYPSSGGGGSRGQPMPLTQHNPQLVRILQGQPTGTTSSPEGSASAGGGIYIPQGGGSPMIMTLAAQPT
jgi:hypothetical protein